jgi:hypothetical protein
MGKLIPVTAETVSNASCAVVCRKVSETTASRSTKDAARSVLTSRTNTDGSWDAYKHIVVSQILESEWFSSP